MNSFYHYSFVKTKAYVESLKNLLANMCLRSLRLIWRLVMKMSNKEDLRDFEAMTEKETDFSPSKLVTFPSE